MEDVVCSNWEDIADNSAVLEERLEQLRLEKARADAPKIRILQRNKAETKEPQRVPSSQPSEPQAEPSPFSSNGPSSAIQLDATREESLRSQYVPRIKLLTRPKEGQAQGQGSEGSVNGNGSGKGTKAQPTKTLQQREKEYMEARKRILGDVQFSDPEEEDGLSPAELLKQKVAEAVDGAKAQGEEVLPEAEDPAASTSKSKKKKKREKFKTPHVESPREFPLNKAETDRILRQPRGPDGTTGFSGGR